MSEAAVRRRANFFRGTRHDALSPVGHNDTSGDDHTLLARAEDQLSAAIQNIAQSRGLGTLPPGDVATMVQKAAPRLKGMSRQALKALSPSSPALFDLAISSIAPILTPDAVARLKFDQIKASHYGTGSMPSDEQIMRGERPIPRTADTLARYSGASGGESSSRYLMLGERFSPQQQVVIVAAQAEAQRASVPWLAASTYQRDLLSIGTSGVKAIADVQIREPSYQRLRTDGRFEAKEVVTLAEFAKSKGIRDANPLAHATADVVQIGTGTAEQTGIKSAIVTYMDASKAAAAAPNDPAVQQRLEQAGQAQRATLAPIAAQSEANYSKVQTYEDQAKVEQRFRVTAQKAEAAAALTESATARKDAGAAKQQAAADDAFGAAPPTQAAAPGAPPDKSAGPVEAKPPAAKEPPKPAMKAGPAVAK